MDPTHRLSTRPADGEPDLLISVWPSGHVGLTVGSREDAELVMQAFGSALAFVEYDSHQEKFERWFDAMREALDKAREASLSETD